MFPVHNPSDLPIYVQLLPFPEKANSLLPPPPTTGLKNPECDVSLVLHCHLFEAFFIPPEACKGVVLQPHSSTQLGPVLFSPQSLQHFNATLYIKNNLTILDHFTLVGEVCVIYFNLYHCILKSLLGWKWTLPFPRC